MKRPLVAVVVAASIFFLFGIIQEFILLANERAYLAELSANVEEPAAVAIAEETPTCASPPAAVEHYQIAQPKSIAHNPLYRERLRLVRNEEAVCEFYSGQFFRHFPHGMELLYPCISYWLEHPNEPWVLYVTIADPAALAASPLGEDAYLPGFMKALSESMNVEIRHQSSTGAVAFARDPDEPYYSNNPEDLHYMRSTILGHFFPQRIDQICPDQQVRVGILDRQGRRQLINVDSLQATVKKILGDNLASVSVEYFEDKPFLDQVSYMADIDLLISPHGAQLTSIPFLPPCAAVVEVFPTGIYIPYFFGSLSTASGHSHYTVYLGKDRAAEEAWGAKHRREVMDQQLCPPSGVLEEVLPRMLTDFRRCCAERSEAQ